MMNTLPTPSGWWVNGSSSCVPYTVMASSNGWVMSTSQSASVQRPHAPPLLASLPPAPPADTFEGYLATAGINFRFSRGRLLATTDPGSAYQQFCAAAAAAFHRWLGLGIAEKRPALAALLRAMMLGQTHELSDEQHGLFMQSGTMHLFAISGLNIGVVAGALQALMLLLRLPAWPRFALGTVLLWLFVDITGGAPSAVRAFVMAVFFQAAFVLRRPRNLLAALAASALLVLLAAPLQVFGASFLMSYGIVAAVLLLGLPLGEAWLKFWTPWRALPVAAWHRVHHAALALAARRRFRRVCPRDLARTHHHARRVGGCPVEHGLQRVLVLLRRRRLVVALRGVRGAS